MMDKPTGGSKVLQTLQALSKVPRPGPAPGFSHVHVCGALLLIGDEGPIGRIGLSKRVGLGEGAIRTIMKRLTNAALITRVKGGCVLTKRGIELHSHLRAKLSKTVPIDAKQLSLDKSSVAILIRSAGRQVKRGIEQRDAAIRAGATGACTLVVRKGEYLMPITESKDWRLKPEDPLARDLMDSLSPRDNDVVAIISAANKGLAEHGAMAAALTLLE